MRHARGPQLRGSAGPIARRLRDRAERAQDYRHDHDLAPGEAGEVPRVAPGVVCVVSGHTAMVSFADLPGRVSLEEIEMTSCVTPADLS